MSSANPVETKMETAVKVIDAAAALAGPTPPIAETAKASWWALRNPKRFGIVAGSTALALAAGTFGWKYLANSSSSTARAQDDTTVLAQAKPEESPKREEPGMREESAKPVPARAPTDEENLLLLKIPTVTTPAPAPSPSPSPKPNPVELDIPPITAPMPTLRPAETEPPLILPTVTPPEPKKPSVDPDVFKAPDPLPSTLTDRKDKPAEKEVMPIIRIEAKADAAPLPKQPMVDTPPPPPLILDVPAPSTPLPKKPMTDAPPPPLIVDVPAPSAPKINDLPPPMPMPMTPKIDDVPPIIGVPSIGPAPEIKTPPAPMPMKERLPDVPPLIKLDEPPVIKNPMIADSPMVGTPPPPPLIKPEKKDVYDEDWHSQREGDTYAIISQQYYKTVDYSAALEAYNKERKKSGERIVRVPPTWVLEEQFPNLVGTKPEKTGVLEAKPTSNPKFEPVAPRVGSERPAPLPSPASSSDEYRVKAEAGETIREIARKVYNDPNAWKKLYELNPNLDPTQPIPSGTTLRLGK